MDSYYLILIKFKSVDKYKPGQLTLTQFTSLLKYYHVSSKYLYLHTLYTRKYSQKEFTYDPIKIVLNHSQNDNIYTQNNRVPTTI